MAEDLRLQPCEPWSRTDKMAKERENFGFYFSAHPVAQFRDVASANGARTYQSLMEAGAPVGGRGSAVMAVLVEGITKARTRKGGTFVRADFSDASGQFSAACFEEALVPDFERWAQAGECLLQDYHFEHGRDKRRADIRPFSSRRRPMGETVTLFRSHNPTYADGGQMRDFVYVDDVVDIIEFLLQSPQVSGIFNAGSGQARSFADLARATFDAAGKKLGTGLIGLAVSDLQKGKPPGTVMDGMRDFVRREEEKKETEET